MQNRVRTIWDQLAGKYCNDTALTGRLFQEIEKKYTTSRRHYHNLEHIDALLHLCEVYAGQLHNRDVVEFSVFYHDIIYNVLRKDNELRSAQVAAKRLRALSVPTPIIEQVKIYIEATQTHKITDAVTHTSDLQLFLDFDMSILGVGWGFYKTYTEQVRREYRIYPNLLYNRGRLQFLAHCLGAEFIFQTAIFRELYEARARENMAKEAEEYINLNL